MSTDNKTDRKVMIAMDGSDHAEYAFKWYLDNIARDTDEVFLVYCVEYSFALPPTLMAASSEDIAAQVEEQNQKFQHFIDRLEEMAKDTKVHGKVLHIQGPAGKAIVQAARERAVDLIIAGSRGLGVIKRTMLGSVSDYVLHHSEVPVIVCKKD